MKRGATIAARSQRSLKTLALSVHFKHPDMEQYEILSRATAFLLAIDPLDPSNSPSATKSTLFGPAGKPKRRASELGWLEFCPTKFRPVVHVVASSHVLSPWLWKQYYPQPWLEHVTQDHVKYSIDVYDDNAKDKSHTGGIQKQLTEDPLATFALNPCPIHHPYQMDLAVVHLKDEEVALIHMEELGVEIMRLSNVEKQFEKNDQVFFEGFELDEVDYQEENVEEKKIDEEDTRVFFNYKDSGCLIHTSQNRVLVTTNEPLPEGICGGPVIDNEGNVCGVVEGIVPRDHEDVRIAGAASYIPHSQIRAFLDYAEKLMLEQIVPEKLFERIIGIKDGKPFRQRTIDLSETEDRNDDNTELNIEELYSQAMTSIRQNQSHEELGAIETMLEREQQEVYDVLNCDGGDVDKAEQKVRKSTKQKQKECPDELISAKESESIARNNKLDGEK